MSFVSYFCERVCVCCFSLQHILNAEGGGGRVGRGGEGEDTGRFSDEDESALHGFTAQRDCGGKTRELQFVRHCVW